MNLEQVAKLTREVAVQTAAAFTPLHVLVQEMTDWQGEPGLDVTLVLPRSALDRDDLGSQTTRINTNLMLRLIKEGESRFPYLGVSAGNHSDV